MNILVTGTAGFIGAAVAEALLNRGDTVVGVDNHNDYYDVNLKEARLERIKHQTEYNHERISLEDRDAVKTIFTKFKPDAVIHLAAQAGVRYSIENPIKYIESNIIGFINIIENCKNNDVKHLVYASSSSVYGANGNTPFTIKQNVNHQLSLYAVTKKTNEEIAHNYSHLFNLPTTGLRFFTVYGPWARPDMALSIFAKAIMTGEFIRIFNNGNHRRDFTYIDDIVSGILLALDKPSKENLNWDPKNPDPSTAKAPWAIYNIGSGKPIELLTCINILEKEMGRKVEKKFLPLQQGDVVETYADIKETTDNLGYKPKVTIEEGLRKFCEWHKKYYKGNE